MGELSSSELVVGDQIRLEAGDRVPADLRLTGATDLFVSQSVITGESAILENFRRLCPRTAETMITAIYCSEARQLQEERELGLS